MHRKGGREGEKGEEEGDHIGINGKVGKRYDAGDLNLGMEEGGGSSESWMDGSSLRSAFLSLNIPLSERISRQFSCSLDAVSAVCSCLTRVIMDDPGSRARATMQ